MHVHDNMNVAIGLHILIDLCLCKEDLFYTCYWCHLKLCAQIFSHLL
jgi:hypothetical protein